MGQPEKNPPEQKKSAGQILKEIRTSKGIPLETIHNVTKIPLDALKAIEEGYQVRTLSPFYMKGFIKMYAEYLGVDVSEILEDYHKERLPGPAKRPYPEDILEKKIKNIFTRERQQLIVKIMVGLVVLFVISKIGGCLFKKRDPSGTTVKKVAVKKEEKKQISKSTQKKQVPAAVQQPESKKKETEQKNAAPPAVTPPTAKKNPPAPVQVSNKAVRLTIRTRKQGWLQVKVDGNLVFQSTIKQGAVETWEADEKIEISGKNIHNLEFEVNGKVLGTLGRADRSARRVVITKDGLKVIQ